MNEFDVVLDETLIETNKDLQQERDLYKSIIDEIFNYLEDHYAYSLKKGIVNNTDVEKLYEILDKAYKGE